MNTEFNAKMSSSGSPDENRLNAEWWNENPMTYDWVGSIRQDAGSKEFFALIDANFGKAHSLVNNPRWPEGYILENFVPYSSVKDERVLEIGCGAGLVSSHLLRAGAHLSAIDIADKSIHLTSKRLHLLGQKADVRQMDAEQLEYQDQEFDRVVSWGVIHHSANMETIIDEIHRVLKHNGRAHIMVYNKNSIRYQIYARWWLGVVKAKYLSMDTEEIIGSITDGYIARHITKDEALELFSAFKQVKVTYSDEPHTILKYLFGVAAPFKPLYEVTRAFQKWLAKRWGWYLEIEVVKS